MTHPPSLILRPAEQADRAIGQFPFFTDLFCYILISYKKFFKRAYTPCSKGDPPFVPKPPNSPTKQAQFDRRSPEIADHYLETGASSSSQTSVVFAGFFPRPPFPTPRPIIEQAELRSRLPSHKLGRFPAMPAPGRLAAGVRTSTTVFFPEHPSGSSGYFNE